MKRFKAKKNFRKDLKQKFSLLLSMVFFVFCLAFIAQKSFAKELLVQKKLEQKQSDVYNKTIFSDTLRRLGLRPRASGVT